MARGFNTTGDVVTTLADGTDLTTLWTDYQDATEAANAQRDQLINPLVFRTTNPADPVLQAWTGDDFEEASEFGEPVGMRPTVPHVLTGYKFRWYDKAGRYTWQFLVDATREQVDSVTNAVVEADNRLVWSAVMAALLNNTERTNAEGHTIFPLWAGAVGDDPPDYNGTTFNDQHNHYVTTNAATLDQPDVDALMNLVLEHGYGDDPSRGRLLLLTHRNEADVIRTYRSDGGAHDFIPNASAPPFLTQDTVVGETAPETVPGGALPLIGAYGPAWVAQHSMVPAGYVICAATAGPNSSFNPVGIREHPTGARGLTLVKGRVPGYPLQDSFWVRGFGTGVRHRGAAAVLQRVAAPTYDAPAAFESVTA